MKNFNYFDERVFLDLSKNENYIANENKTSINELHLNSMSESQSCIYQKQLFLHTLIFRYLKSVKTEHRLIQNVCIQSLVKICLREIQSENNW